MMKRIYVACDTTGRYNFREGVAHDSQPHLARLAWITADDGAITSQWSALIQPHHKWVYEDDAVVAHGITPERAQQDGLALGYVMARFIGALDNANEVVAFNVDFVRKVCERAALDAGLNWRDLFHAKTLSCAMRRATDIVQMPRMAPGGGFNWPKLRDAYEFFANDELPSIDMDPVERGVALARCTFVIDEGIRDHQRSAPHE